MERVIEEILALIANVASSGVDRLPVGYAFGAGMLATVNPCGFALLPAYVSLYLGDTAEGFAEAGTLRRLLKGLLVSLAMTLGFVLLFGAVGLVIVSGGRFLVDVMPWASLVIGLAMVLLGILLLLGKVHIHIGMALRLSTKINVQSPYRPTWQGGTESALIGKGALGGIRSYFLFGIAYGICSLSCTLPIFLIVVGISSTASNFLNGMYQFISYALGMGGTLLVLTLGTAVFKEVVGSALRQMVPYVERASAGLIALAGIFVIYYWLTIGELGESLRALF